MFQSIIARITSIFAWWLADIRRRSSFIGKAASLLIGLFVLCCVCSVGLTAVRSTGQAIGLVAKNTPTSAPTDAPATEQPTAEVLAQLATDAPTDPPAATDVPTVEPPTVTEQPAPTNAPVATKAPVAKPTGEPAPKPTAASMIASGAAPQGSACPDDHPVKGNIVSRGANKGEKIYHVKGDNGYAQTKPERCFADVTEAQAAGYRPVK